MTTMITILFIILIVFIPHTLSYTGAKMGIQNECDDGKTSLERDWDGDFKDYSCMHGENLQETNASPIYYSIPDFNPQTDQVEHECMNVSIVYDDSPPIRGQHRPIWAIFGEYLYLPPQRWLHNLEHGSIILLYHPCLLPEILDKIRSLVISCVYRYIITPSKSVKPELPIILVSWGSKLELPQKFNRLLAATFIKRHAQIAPENFSKQGLFDKYLLKPSEIVSPESTIDDIIICPWLKSVDYSVGNSLLNELSHINSSKIKNGRVPRSYPYMQPQSPYDRLYLSELQKFNGPKYANDVLPPSAIKYRFASPNYVMAGTYLGTDPFNPNILPKYDPVNPTNPQSSNKNANINRQHSNPMANNNINFVSNNVNQNTASNNQNIKLMLLRLLLQRYKQNAGK